MWEAGGVWGRGEGGWGKADGNSGKTGGLRVDLGGLVEGDRKSLKRGPDSDACSKVDVRIKVTHNASFLTNKARAKSLPSNTNDASMNITGVYSTGHRSARE